MTCPTCAAIRGLVYAKEDPPREHTDAEVVQRVTRLVRVAQDGQERKRTLDVIIDALGGSK